jgi:hypothetical protein
MKNYVILSLIMLALGLALISCGASRRHFDTRRGLMLLEDHEHARNARFHSSDERQKKRKTYRKFKRRNTRAYRNGYVKSN